jgi:hypothetical protein
MSQLSLCNDDNWPLGGFATFLAFYSRVASFSKKRSKIFSKIFSGFDFFNAEIAF